MSAKRPRANAMGYVIALSQVGLEMVVPIGLGVIIDQWLGTVPWIMIVGVFVGLFGGLAHMMVILNRMDRTKPPDSK